MTGAQTPILHGVCQGDFDFAGYRALNLDLSGLSSGAPFFDDTALIRAAGDATKLARFNISANTTGIQRVFTLPNYSGIVATVAGAESFINKTGYNGLVIEETTGELDINNSAQIVIDGNLAFTGPFTMAGGFLTVLTATGITSLTLPTSGTLATTAQLPIISDIAYDATTWNGNLDGASKNSIRDKFESLTVGVLLPPFDDTETLVRNKDDITKLLKISLAGLTTGTTRTATMPDKNGTLAMLDDVPDYAGILFDADQPDRELYLAGNVGFFGPFTMAGGFLTILTATGMTEITLPLTGTLATLAGAETLTNKSIDGGTVESITKLSLHSSGSNYDLTIEPNAVMTSDRKLTLSLGDADRTLTLGNDFSTSGNFPIILTVAASTNLVLPATGEVTVDVGVPANAGDSGVAGQRAYDSGFEYRCVATNTWKRVAIATWP